MYVCNVATQPGETAHFDVNAHVKALQRHVGDLFPVVLANDRIIPSRGEMAHLEPVALPAEPPVDYTAVDRRRDRRRSTVAARLGQTGAGDHGRFTRKRL